ncbi:4827_t:CDS:2 [Acaulospora morrowiae]|uniref:4827_t:CDS:1 n=1 Tax=Acaulospora morrowiae TaxID=94023 RepID=A0A9N9FEZ2_9GLOM|nr:4827_t:CDS:2 [Acaulospora morrowiae]
MSFHPMIATALCRIIRNEESGNAMRFEMNNNNHQPARLFQQQIPQIVGHPLPGNLQRHIIMGAIYPFEPVPPLGAVSPTPTFVEAIIEGR